MLRAQLFGFPLQGAAFEHRRGAAFDATLLPALVTSAWLSAAAKPSSSEA